MIGGHHPEHGVSTVARQPPGLDSGQFSSSGWEQPCGCGSNVGAVVDAGCGRLGRPPDDDGGRGFVGLYQLRMVTDSVADELTLGQGWLLLDIGISAA